MRTTRDAIDRSESVGREPLWVESSDQKDAARALEMLHVQLISAVIDPYSWKWVIVILHHTVQGFVIASLADHDPGSGESAAAHPALSVHYRDPARYREARSDYLPPLYERMKELTGFQPAPEVDRDLARMIECRDAFIQAVPSTWKLRVNELPRASQNCLRIVEFLGWSPGHIRWQRENLVDLARVKFLASMKVLDALEAQYQS